MRFLHTADLQLGARFSQFREHSKKLREARVDTLRRILKLAVDENVDALIIAGDIFEDNQVSEKILDDCAKIFSDHPDIPVFLLPGNHDPADGPGSVWARAPFDQPPPNVTVLSTPTAIPLGNAVILASPLTQKLGNRDPSLLLDELAAGVHEPDSTLKIGVTHGSLQIPGKHKPDDHPIALDAATRAGLDYLAVGHWHSWSVYDDCRLVMPGTPEPDSFDQSSPGSVALVELSSPGVPPRIERREISTLTWHEFALDFINHKNQREALGKTLLSFQGKETQSIIRITLSGSAPVADKLETTHWLNERLKDFFISEITDRTTPSFSPAEITDLQQNHPVLAAVISDLHAAHAIATDVRPQGGNLPLSLSDLKDITGGCPTGLEDMDDAFFQTAQELLFHKFREAQ